MAMYNLKHGWGIPQDVVPSGYFAHAHEIPTIHVCDIWKMKSVLLLLVGFYLVAAQTPERCGTYSD
jgi:hypothetical protein